MNKKERLELIKSFVSQYDIDTQEEIVERLHLAGIKATQATVSRDIKEIGIIKVPHDKYHYVYGLPKASPGARTIQQQNILEMTTQGQFINIQVVPGATALVKRQLKTRFGSQIFNLVGDDDTLLLILKDGVSAQEFISNLED